MPDDLKPEASYSSPEFDALLAVFDKYAGTPAIGMIGERTKGIYRATLKRLFAFFDRKCMPMARCTIIAALEDQGPGSQGGQLKAALKALNACVEVARVADPTVQLPDIPTFPDGRALRSTPGYREGAPVHPIGIAVSVWVEHFVGKRSVDTVEKALENLLAMTWAQAHDALGGPTRKRFFLTRLRSVLTIRWWTHKDMEIPQTDEPFLFNRPANRVFTPEEITMMVRAEGLTFKQLKEEGYFFNRVIVHTPADDMYYETAMFDYEKAFIKDAPMNLVQILGPNESFCRPSQVMTTALAREQAEAASFEPQGYGKPVRHKRYQSGISNEGEVNSLLLRMFGTPGLRYWLGWEDDKLTEPLHDAAMLTIVQDSQVLAGLTQAKLGEVMNAVVGLIGRKPETMAELRQLAKAKLATIEIPNIPPASASQ